MRVDSLMGEDIYYIVSVISPRDRLSLKQWQLGTIFLHRVRGALAAQKAYTHHHNGRITSIDLNRSML